MTDEIPERDDWDRHWRRLRGSGASVFGGLASLVRRSILAPAVHAYSERTFPAGGVLLEAGCGTAQASAAIPAAGRTLIGLDFSLAALLEARRGGSPQRRLVSGDIRALPFADDSLDGIWNLGVMEHFTAEAGNAVLRELRRALRPGACALLFWPPEHGLSRLVLAPIEWLRSRGGRPFHFFPDEVNRLRSRAHGRETLHAAGLEPVAVDFTPRDAFIHLVLVGRKPPR